VLAAMSVLPLLPGGGVTDLFTNRVFLAGFWAWFCAQTLKVRLRNGRLLAAPRWSQSGVAVCALAATSHDAPPPPHTHTPQIFTKRLKKGVWDLRAIVDSGGMPSSHSALCAVSLL
jgi:acid phosphatase family membrane protein YuiD